MQLFRGPVSGQKVLGQGRSLVRQVRFVSDNRDPACKVQLPERDGRLRPRVTASDYQDVVVETRVNACCPPGNCCGTSY